jgi:hypothetical protein
MPPAAVPIPIWLLLLLFLLLLCSSLQSSSAGGGTPADVDDPAPAAAAAAAAWIGGHNQPEPAQNATVLSAGLDDSEKIWVLVFRQTATAADAWRDLDAWKSYGSDEKAPNYSVLDALDELLGDDDDDQDYHLKLMYPLLDKGSSNEWTQTESPMKSEGKNAKVPGYKPIKLAWDNGPFIGLQLCTDCRDDGTALICSQNNRGNWWYALGCKFRFTKLEITCCVWSVVSFHSDADRLPGELQAQSHLRRARRTCQAPRKTPWRRSSCI